jgi:hypothetical protein
MITIVMSYFANTFSMISRNDHGRARRRGGGELAERARRAGTAAQTARLRGSASGGPEQQGALHTGRRGGPAGAAGDCGDLAAHRRAAQKLTRQRGIAWPGSLFLVFAGALCPPGRNYRLRGIPFGWSRVAPLAERRPRTSAWHALESGMLRGRRHVCWQIARVPGSALERARDQAAHVVALQRDVNDDARDHGVNRLSLVMKLSAPRNSVQENRNA